MSNESAEGSAAYQVPLKVYDDLSSAMQEEKVDIVLRLVEDHPKWRLELPKTKSGEFADLSGIDLRPEILRIRVEKWTIPRLRWELLRRTTWRSKLETYYFDGTTTPPWWNPLFGVFYLKDAHLEGARLYGANLERAQLWDVHLAGADLEEANLQGALLYRADLRGANLEGADLRRVDMERANLENANLSRAQLQGAKMRHANLHGAHLNGARLEGVDLSGADLHQVWVAGALFGKTVMLQSQIGTKIAEEIHAESRVMLSRRAVRLPRRHPGHVSDHTGPRKKEIRHDPVSEERARRYHEAGRGYRGLKQNFDDLGDYQAASWAYRRERLMRKSAARFEATKAWKTGQHRESLAYLGSFTSDSVAQTLCDYGENPWRVIRWLFFVMVGFALIYGSPCGVGQALSDGSVRPVGPLEPMLFSLGAMTTMGPSALSSEKLVLTHPWMQFLPGLEALIAVTLAGLLGFVIGNRIRKS